MESIHLEISGRVQGVGFRWFVRERARELRLSGWVRNRHDGAVEVAASGEAEALLRFQTALRDGPSGATVESLRPLPPVPAELLKTPFEITR